MFRDRVRERDLDHFLIEELHSSTPFREWFIDHLSHCLCVPTGCVPRVERAARRTGDGRETDVRLSFSDSTGAVLAEVLIENKVTEDFQEGQAESYSAEVAARRAELGKDRVAAVLIAPAARLTALAGEQHFDCAISVESMAEKTMDRAKTISEDELRRRLLVKAELLDAILGKRPKSLWIPTTIQEKRNFAQRYEQLVDEILPSLKVRPSTDGPRALTRFFDGLRIPASFPCRVTLKHEFGAGVASKYVNLQFDGKADAIDLLMSTQGLFPPDRSIFPTRGGKSLMVRIATPGLVPDGEQFDEQHDKIVAGLKAVSRLSDWIQQHAPRLQELLG